MHRISKLAPLARPVGEALSNVTHGPKPSSGTLGPSGPLSGLASRPVSTVATGTKFGKDGKVSDAGHIQLQPSRVDLANYPGLKPALGHSPADNRAGLEKFQVQGQLNNGKGFTVTAHRNDAKNAGDDKVIDPHKPGSIVIDHGDMTPAQAKAYLAQQDKPVFPKYETSGRDGANCVHAHAKLMNDVLGHDVGHVPTHTMPQELAEKLQGVKTDRPADK